MKLPKGIKLGDMVEIVWEDVKSNSCISVEATMELLATYPKVRTLGFLKHVGKDYVVIAPEYEGESDKEASVWTFPRRVILGVNKLRRERFIRF